MSNNRRVLTKEQALECLIIEDNQVHSFISTSFGLIGADWDIEEVKESMDEAESIEIGGEQSRKLNHVSNNRKRTRCMFF